VNTAIGVHVSTLRALARPKLPVELWIALGFGGLWLVGVAAGLPINLPTISETRLVNFHFFGPLLLAAGIQLALVVPLRYASDRNRQSSNDAFLMAKLFPFVVLSVFLYFNFKAWMPLVRPHMYDAQLEQLDLQVAPLVQSLRAVRQVIAASAPFNVDSMYLNAFVAMFFFSLGTHALVDPAYRQRQLVLGLCLNLVLGGLAYWIMPAVGPFLYHRGLNAEAHGAQQIMYGMFEQVQASGLLPAGYFSAPLGAMPSLHTAHALFFTLCATRSARILLPLYVPLTLWILVEASASGWHYLADLPAGAILAIVSFVFATRLVSKPS
jgi:hypothetical protein